MLRHVLVDGQHDLGRRRHDRHGTPPRAQLDLVERLDVERVGHRDDDRAVLVVVQRDDHAAARDALREDRDGVTVERVVGERDPRDALLRRQGVGQLRPR